MTQDEISKHRAELENRIAAELAAWVLASAISDGATTLGDLESTDAWPALRAVPVAALVRQAAAPAPPEQPKRKRGPRLPAELVDRAVDALAIIRGEGAFATAAAIAERSGLSRAEVRRAMGIATRAGLIVPLPRKAEGWIGAR